eukprot:CAMPEP_0197591362 /NCGR_PEP_ID=MMETSP1326-20131121/13030_1 /TAXON_ID=1155430 /ORGANISM="Genus nov. species nov., Strain RCC2288" /LENGTH=109 /DNA_ID=CAMNT_0043156771 /DNA_START=489 /DNA_END=820 /DNA_ORIENTATION=+
MSAAAAEVSDPAASARAQRVVTPAEGGAEGGCGSCAGDVTHQELHQLTEREVALVGCPSVAGATVSQSTYAAASVRSSSALLALSSDEAAGVENTGGGGGVEVHHRARA